MRPDFARSTKLGTGSLFSAATTSQYSSRPIDVQAVTTNIGSPLLGRAGRKRRLPCGQGQGCHNVPPVLVDVKYLHASPLLLCLGRQPSKWARCRSSITPAREANRRERSLSSTHLRLGRGPRTSERGPLHYGGGVRVGDARPLQTLARDEVAHRALCCRAYRSPSLSSRPPGSPALATFVVHAGCRTGTCPGKSRRDRGPPHLSGACRVCRLWVRRVSSRCGSCSGSSSQSQRSASPCWCGDGGSAGCPRRGDRPKLGRGGGDVGDPDRARA